MDVGILLHHLENHIGIVVLITNRPSSLDSAFQRRIRFELKFEMPPPSLRSKLWRAMIPAQVIFSLRSWSMNPSAPSVTEQCTPWNMRFNLSPFSF